MFVVIVGFALANVAFYAILPVQVIAGSETVAAVGFARSRAGNISNLMGFGNN